MARFHLRSSSVWLLALVAALLLAASFVQLTTHAEATQGESTPVSRAGAKPSAPKAGVKSSGVKVAPAGASSSAPAVSSGDLVAQFAAYKKRFHRKYKSPATEARAFAAFSKRQQRALARNTRARRTKTGVAKVFDAAASPLGDVEDEVFKKKYLNAGRRPSASSLTKVRVRPSTASRASASTASTSSKPASKVQTRKAVRFAQRARARGTPLQPTPPPPALPSTHSVKAPLAGDQIPKKRIGGDNLDKALPGGDQLPKKRLGGDQLPKKRIGGLPSSPTSSQSQSGPMPISKYDPYAGRGVRADLSGEPWTIQKPLSPFSQVHAEFDLRGRAFPPVRDQGSCKSCWAVVAVEHFQAILETTYENRVDDLRRYRLSAQMIIDCQRTADDQGCDGGTVVGAFDYMQLHGIVHAQNYEFPLNGIQNPTCGKVKDFDAKGFTIPMFKARESLFFAPPCLGAVCAPNPKVEQQLLDFWRSSPERFGDSKKQMIFNIPMVAYVDASSWASYTGEGIFPSSACSSSGSDLSHIVQIIGYGAMTNDAGDHQAYWMVRNSWGPDWGFQGHILLPFGENACGLFNYVIYLKPGVYSRPVVSQRMVMMNGGVVGAVAGSNWPCKDNGNPCTP